MFIVYTGGIFLKILTRKETSDDSFLCSRLGKMSFDASSGIRMSCLSDVKSNSVIDSFVSLKLKMIILVPLAPGIYLNCSFISSCVLMSEWSNIALSAIALLPLSSSIRTV